MKQGIILTTWRACELLVNKIYKHTLNRICSSRISVCLTFRLCYSLSFFLFFSLSFPSPNLSLSLSFNNMLEMYHKSLFSSPDCFGWFQAYESVYKRSSYTLSRPSFCLTPDLTWPWPEQLPLQLCSHPSHMSFLIVWHVKLKCC